MGIGLGILLIVLGAILAFTPLVDDIVGTNLDMIGLICLGAGVLALIMAVVLNNQRNNTSHTTVVEHRDTGVPPEAVRRTDDPRA